MVRDKIAECKENRRSRIDNTARRFDDAVGDFIRIEDDEKLNKLTADFHSSVYSYGRRVNPCSLFNFSIAMYVQILNYGVLAPILRSATAGKNRQTTAFLFSICFLLCRLANC